jgi:hypothetical protein
VVDLLSATHVIFVCIFVGMKAFLKKLGLWLVGVVGALVLILIASYFHVGDEMYIVVVTLIIVSILSELRRLRSMNSEK